VGVTLLADTSVLIAPPDGPDDERIVASTISIGELHAGVELARDDRIRSARLRRLTGIIAAVPILPVDGAVAARYGELRGASRRIGSNDLWIAATALAHDLELLTRDERLASLPLITARLAR
jgi:predicted nucleic acid-binding protein